MQVVPNRPDAELKNLCDLFVTHLTDSPQEQALPLLRGQSVHRAPYAVEFVRRDGCSQRVRPRVARRNLDFLDRFGAFDPASPGGLRAATNVSRDPGKPGLEQLFFPQAGDASERTIKNLLHEIFRIRMLKTVGEEVGDQATSEAIN